MTAGKKKPAVNFYAFKEVITCSNIFSGVY